MSKLKKQQEKLFAQYLAKNHIFIVDSNASSRARLAKTLIDLGAKKNGISTFKNYDQAEEQMSISKPKMVLTDYMVGKRSGFDLLKSHRKKFPDSKDSIFVLVTANSSQSLVAQAAEEDIDTFVLKPYTLEILRNILITTAIAKLYPSDYMKTIERGKGLLFDGNVELSVPVFQEAMELHDRPTLACFYHGHAKMLLKNLSMAEEKFKEGLSFNKIHYKCLTDLFDVLYKSGRFEDAYDVVKTISQYFPANPDRLATVLRLAIMTENYSDIERYYHIFTSLEHRTDELVTYICAALLICGKFYLQSKRYNRAFKLFEDASVSCSGRGKFIRIIIEYLIEFKLYDKTKLYFSRFDPNDRNGDDFIIASFLNSIADLYPEEIIRKSMEFIKDKVENYCIYRILIITLSEMKRTNEAAGYLKSSLTKFPEMQQSLVRLSQLYNLQAEGAGHE